SARWRHSMDSGRWQKNRRFGSQITVACDFVLVPILRLGVPMRAKLCFDGGTPGVGWRAHWGQRSRADNCVPGGSRFLHCALRFRLEPGMGGVAHLAPVVLQQHVTE